MFSGSPRKYQIYESVNKQLEIECCAFREQFIRIKERFAERSCQSRTPKIRNSEYLGKLGKYLASYKKEHQQLEGLIKTRQGVYTEIELEKRIKTLKARLKSVEKENEKLNRRKFIEKEATSNKDTEDLQLEFENIRGLVDKMREKSEKTCLLMGKNEDKIKDLEMIYSELSQKVELNETVAEEKNEQIQLLSKKLKCVECSMNINLKRMNLKIVELEKELKELNSEHFSRKTKLLKKNQQKRLIEMSHSEAILNKAHSRSPIIGRLNHVDVSFLYKPSVSRLYNLS